MNLTNFNLSQRSKLVGLCKTINDCDAAFSAYIKPDKRVNLALRRRYGPPNSMNE